MNKNFKYILIVFGCLIISFIIKMVFLLGLFFLMMINSKIEVNTDIKKYNEYIGNFAKEKYKNKWGMDENIFPKMITNNMNVLDYKMVYYDYMDKQFLSYLVVKYDEKDFVKEKERLNKYDSTRYKNYYSVTGFTNYHLLAIYANPYNGFVYAITDNENTIIYVELIFCNYFYDIDYQKYIPNRYLPDGFDATYNNNYQKEMMED